MFEKIELKKVFPVTPERLYQAWLSSEEHTKMTGGPARCSDVVGDEHSAWDGYITGKNISLRPNEEIVQSWRTSEFPSDHEDSKVEIHLRAIESGTELILIHTNIPQGQTQYEQGWVDHYFAPMEEYFKN